MRIPFVGPAYRTRSLNQSAQRCVNLYLEATERGGKTEYTLYGTPGLVLRATVGDGPIRGTVVLPGYMLAVSGDEVYRVNPDWTSTLLGTIGTESGPVFMAWNGTQVLLVDGENGYVITNVVTAISDPDFPNGVTWCAYLDSYFIVGGNQSQRFYISDLADGSSWVGTEFASAEGSPDLIVAGIVDHRELWLFGTNTTEVWVNTGNATFPIERLGNAFIEHGCAAVSSVAKLDNTVFWLGQDDRGSRIIWRANGYNPQRISTHAIEYAMAQYGEVSDAVAYTYQQEGHSFYVISFPSGNATWAYDVSTGEWAERAWFFADESSLNRHRGNTHCYFNNLHILGDYENGKLYSYDLDAYTDFGGILKRLRSTTVLEQEQTRIFYHSLQVDLETGSVIDSSDPQMMLRWSNDGGHVWSDYRTASLGRVGEHGKRVKFNRLGSGRNRVWEISVTDPVKIAITGAILQVSPGEN